MIRCRNRLTRLCAAMLEADLRAYLLTAPAIAALVGAHVFGMRVPQGIDAPRAIKMQRTHTQRQILFCGTDSMVNAEFQVDCYALELDQALELALAVRRVLIDFKGTMGTTYIEQMTLAQEMHVDDADPGRIRMMQLYNIWYLED